MTRLTMSDDKALHEAALGNYAITLYRGCEEITSKYSSEF